MIRFNLKEISPHIVSMVENIRIDLKNTHESMFNEIKQEYQIQTKTEVIKLFIEEGYKYLSKKYFFLELDTNIRDEFSQLFQNPQINRQIGYYHVHEFIREIVRTKLMELRDMRSSLTDWGIMRNLNEFDKKIAIAIRDYEIMEDHGIDSEYLSEILNESPSRINKRLEYFYFNNYLDRIELAEGHYLYHSPIK